MYFIYDIKIDYKTNEMIQNKENMMWQKKLEIFSSFIQFYNYPNNGVVTKTHNSLLIYDNAIKKYLKI